jgi:hypothetical protein
MHYRTLLTPFLLLALHGMAQDRATLSTLNSSTIRLQRDALSFQKDAPALPKDDLSLPEDIRYASAMAGFNHFEVIDERADTSRIGIHTCIPDFGPNYDRQLVFDQSAAQQLSGYLNQYYTNPDAPCSALVILRTLWLSDANYPRTEMLRHPERRLERTHIRLKAEIYAIRDGRYIPVLRFDTLQTAWKKRIISERSPYFEWGLNLSLLIDEVADSASRLLAKQQDVRPSVALDDIRQFNASRFNAPIGDTQPARGVYANFEEFRNNTPSIHDFEVKMENNERLLYIRESGTAYYSHKVWGYCDGRNIYIMRDGILFPAWREGKAFYIPAGAAASSSLTVRLGHDYKQRRIFFVDMDTGDIY